MTKPKQEKGESEALFRRILALEELVVELYGHCWQMCGTDAIKGAWERVEKARLGDDVPIEEAARRAIG